MKISKWICNTWELPSAKVGPPLERHLTMLFSPGANDYQKATILLSYLPPSGGTLDHLHSHADSDEIMYFMGRGKAVLGEESTSVENGTIIIAPQGVPHSVLNTSDAEALKVLCVFIPPVVGNEVYDSLDRKTRGVLKDKA